MPYIKQDRRDALNTPEKMVCGPGELNYLLTQQCDRFLQSAGP